MLDACNLTIHIGLRLVLNSWLTCSRFVYGPVIILKIRQRNLHPITSISRSIVPVIVSVGGRGLSWDWRIMFGLPLSHSSIKTFQPLRGSQRLQPIFAHLYCPGHFAQGWKTLRKPLWTILNFLSNKINFNN